MERLVPIRDRDQMPESFRGTPVAELVGFHNLGDELRAFSEPRLLIGMCMDHRKRLRLPENFAYVLRSGGGNLRYSEFKVSFAVAVGGVRTIVLIAHSRCGMVDVSRQREPFVSGLVERAGWTREEAERHFDEAAPAFEIGDEIDFVIAEAERLRRRYPKIHVEPLYYRVEDGLLYGLREVARRTR